MFVDICTIIVINSLNKIQIINKYGVLKHIPPFINSQPASQQQASQQSRPSKLKDFDYEIHEPPPIEVFRNSSFANTQSNNKMLQNDIRTFYLVNTQVSILANHMANSC